MLTLIVIIIVVIIIFILLGIFYIRNQTKSNIYFTDNKLCDIEHNLKTGDIILFESMENGTFYGNLKHYIISTILGIKYKHSGLVVKYNNELYLIECCRYTQAGYNYASYVNKNNMLTKDKNARPGGVRIIKLYDILNEYSKEYRGKFCIKFIKEEIPNELIFKEFNKYEDIKFGSMKKTFFKGVFDIFLGINKNDSDNKNDMICSEFIHKILSDCDIVKKKIASNVFWPYYYYNGKFDKLANNQYTNPISFEYNYY